MSQGCTNPGLDTSAYRPGGTDVAVADGGTGLSSYTAGDLIYASGTTTLAKLAKGTKYQILRQNSGLTAPEWATGREVLTAARTYYVRTDGSDSNTGLANTAGGAFLTWQKAADVVYGTLDLGGYNVTVQVADGTYTAGLSITSRQVGAGTVTFQGNSGTPANVLLSVTSANAVYVSNSTLTLKDFELRTTTGGICIVADSGALVTFSNLRFGACASVHIYAASYANVSASGNYTISGSAVAHWDAVNGTIGSYSNTITLSGSPAFSWYFAVAYNAGVLAVESNTYSGPATGARYYAFQNGVIATAGGTLPGDSAGTTATGGQYT